MQRERDPQLVSGWTGHGDGGGATDVPSEDEAAGTDPSRGGQRSGSMHRPAMSGPVAGYARRQHECDRDKHSDTAETFT